MSQPFSNQSKTEAQQISWVIFAWLLIGVSITIYDYSLSLSPYVTFHNITFRQMLVTQVTVTFVSGLITGTIVIKYFLKWIRNRAYGQALLMVLAVYSMMSFLTAFISLTFFFNYQLGLRPFSSELQTRVFVFIFGP